VAEPCGCQAIVRPFVWTRSCESRRGWPSRRKDPFVPEIVRPATPNLSPTRMRRHLGVGFSRRGYLLAKQSALFDYANLGPAILRPRSFI